jgi:hypothetical protein
MRFSVVNAKSVDGIPTVVVLRQSHVIAHLNGLTPSDLTLLVESPDGTIVCRIPGTDALSEQGLLVWTFHPESLPSSTQFAVLTREERAAFGSAFDPKALRDALVTENLDAAAELWDHRNDQQADTDSSGADASSDTSTDPSAGADVVSDPSTGDAGADDGGHPAVDYL